MDFYIYINLNRLWTLWTGALQDSTRLISVIKIHFGFFFSLGKWKTIRVTNIYPVIHPSIDPPIHPSTYPNTLPICPFIHPYIHPSTHLFIHTNLPIHPSMDSSITHPSIHPFFCQWFSGFSWLFGCCSQLVWHSYTWEKSPVSCAVV